MPNEDSTNVRLESFFAKIGHESIDAVDLARLENSGKASKCNAVSEMPG